jgi:hypothetical protein
VELVCVLRASTAVFNALVVVTYSRVRAGNGWGRVVRSRAPGYASVPRPTDSLVSTPLGACHWAEAEAHFLRDFPSEGLTCAHERRSRFVPIDDRRARSAPGARADGTLLLDEPFLGDEETGAD